ncbi:MAG TPA: NAD(P)-binding domain-containing protein [Polyangiaceae bacterium]|nr:NAD(P)-binding domain-containing protein [Polyangiaceae bacterium]
MTEVSVASPPRVCVIGAGTSGLVAAKALQERGIEFECFDASDRVGGLWVFKNKNGRSGAYRSLHINTSRDRMQFRDFPMPRSYPDYPHRELIASYLASYAEHFELTRHIHFETPVTRVTPGTRGGYDVSAGGKVTNFTAVVVANGHHWSPRMPDPMPEGEFTGLELHSHHYVDPTEPHDLRGKRVVVVGFGNSAVDIACELGRDTHGGEVFLSVRRGAWVLPKYALGRPLDQLGVAPPLVPRALRQALVELWYRIAVGDPTRFGLPVPDHRLGDAHPTVSSELLTQIGSGAVRPKPAIVRRDGKRVTFSDGTTEMVDAIVYGTGYHVSFPFFEPSFLSAPNNEFPLYFRIFHPRAPGVYFIGLCQPLGPIMPIAEAQAKLVAAHVAGDYALPGATLMENLTRRERERLRARFGDSPRHTMQLDFDEYLAALAGEAASGQKRAALARHRSAAKVGPSRA